MRRNALVLVILLSCAATRAQESQTHATSVGTVHELVWVPEGEFLMGGDRLYYEIAHRVYLDSYYIDKFEVTVGHYAAFLNAAGSDTAGPDGEVWIEPHRITGPGSWDRGQFRRREDPHEPFEPLFPDSTDHPVIRVTWFGAQAYCEWAGLRLPTEAEWEKAARGVDGRTYPWGEGFDRSRANYGVNTSTGPEPDSTDGAWTTAPVGSYPAGASPYGALDMSGNVMEWVNDWFNLGEPTYYETGPYRNPTGPDQGIGRVGRGGSWVGVEPWPTWFRWSSAPLGETQTIGFRCARDAGAGPTSVPQTTWGRLKHEVPSPP